MQLTIFVVLTASVICSEGWWLSLLLQIYPLNFFFSVLAMVHIMGIILFVYILFKRSNKTFSKCLNVRMCAALLC